MSKAIIKHEPDILQAVQLIADSGLLPDGETGTRIKALMKASVDPEATPQARKLWLAHEGSTCIGMAMVSDPEPGSEGLPILSVSVSPARRHCGLGRALVARAQRDYPCLAAFHSESAQNMLARVGIPTVDAPKVEHDETDMDRCANIQRQISKMTSRRRRP